MDLVEYALHFIGVPYIWGGAHPAKGLDCSGLVQECLKAIGKDPAGDQTAQALFKHFAIKGKQAQLLAKRNSLLFFGKSTSSITHIAIAINDVQMVEAGGGGSNCVTREDAIKHEAMVRVRPIKNRADLVAILDVL